MATHTHKPIGSIGAPPVLCGLTGAALAIGLDAMGFFAGVSAWLHELYASQPFQVEEAWAWERTWDWGISVALAIAISYAVMDSARMWRRVFIGLGALVLLLGFSPALMLWGMFWSPVMVTVAVLWAWFCAMVYAGSHVMPCDDDIEEAWEEELEEEAEQAEEQVKDLLEEKGEGVVLAKEMKVSKESVQWPATKEKYKPKTEAEED